MLFICLALQNCAHAWVKIACSGTEGLPRRDLQSLTDSSLHFQPARHPSSTAPDTPPGGMEQQGVPREETEIKYCGFCLRENFPAMTNQETPFPPPRAT